MASIKVAPEPDANARRILTLDLDYTQRRLLRLDLGIMLRTAAVMLTGRGAG
jgi:lipopolysaccharide/colanic/teichoic acid biosynthesis glycosyltransferase